MSWWWIILVMLMGSCCAHAQTKAIPGNAPIGTASKCARFDSSGNLAPASGDCSAGDTTTGNTNLIFINSAPDFVGTISDCTGGAVVDGATGCLGRATTFDSQVAPPNAYFMLEGRYVAATPATTSDGFKVMGAHMSNRSCATDTNKCGQQITNLSASIDTLVLAHNGVVAGFARGGRIVLEPGDYLVSMQHPVRIVGSGTTLDACAGPVAFFDNINDAADSSLGTGTVTVGTAADQLVFASSLCGTGNCLDGDELVRPSYNLLFGGTDWYAGPQYRVVKVSTDGKTVTFTPPRTSDFSGTVRVASNHLVELDNQSPTTGSGPLDLVAGTQGGCGWNIREEFRSKAIASNLYPAAQRTAAAGYRVIPAALLLTYFSWAPIDWTLGVPCGPGDLGVGIAGSNTATGSYVGTAVTGQLLGCGSWDEQKLAIAGADPNSTADDPPSAMIFAATPNITIKPSALVTHPSTMLWGHGLGNIDADFTYVEDYVRLVRSTAWLQGVNIQGLSEEQRPQCGSSFPTASACLSGANIPPANDLDFTIGDPGTNGVFGSFTMRFAGIFGNSEMKEVFMKVKGPSSYHIELTGAVFGYDSLVDVSGASSKTVFSGHVQLKSMNSTTAPGVADFSDLVLQDGSGAALSW